MRIVSGKFGGRRFEPPAKIPARPTTEMAREALFNMLGNMTELDGARTLELFGGTGSISYELASHGATDITIVEKDAVSVAFIKKTAQQLAISDSMRIIKGDVFSFMKQHTEQYRLIFADPPYALPNIDDLPKLIFERHLLLPNGIFVLEHAPRNNYEMHPHFTRMKNYGTTTFTFFTQPGEL